MLRPKGYETARSQKSESALGAKAHSPPIHWWVSMAWNETRLEKVGFNARPHPGPLPQERGNCPPVAGSGFGLRASFGFRHSDFGFPFMSLLEVKNLKVHFPVKHGMFSRVRGFCLIDALPDCA